MRRWGCDNYLKSQRSEHGSGRPCVWELDDLCIYARQSCRVFFVLRQRSDTEVLSQTPLVAVQPRFTGYIRLSSVKPFSRLFPFSPIPPTSQHTTNSHHQPQHVPPMHTHCRRGRFDRVQHSPSPPPIPRRHVERVRRVLQLTTTAQLVSCSYSTLVFAQVLGPNLRPDTNV